MAIKSIEVICLPCPKCASLEAKLREIVKKIEIVNRIKIPFEYKHTTTLKDITQYSLNPSQTPAILVNGIVESAGKVNLTLVQRRLEVLQRS